MKTIIVMIAALTLASCASNYGSKTTPQNRAVAQAADADLANQLSEVNLVDVMSANSGYWSVKRGEINFFGRYKAYIVTRPDADYNDLYVFAEKDALESLPQFKDKTYTKESGKLPKAQKVSDFNLIVKNQSFVWGGAWGGTEPTLTTNKRGSLVIQSMNEGVGRSAWSEQVIARLNPKSAKVEVIGYEYTSYDKIDGSGLNCSFNFSTGAGYVTKTPVQMDGNGNEKNPLPKSVKTTVSIPKATINLNDWKSGPENKSTAKCSN